MSDQEREKDAISGVETTGHEWDGIRELDNPLPRWWLWVFWATVLFSIGYWVAFPAWPGVSGYTQGLLGSSDRRDVATARADLETVRGALLARGERPITIADLAVLEAALFVPASAFAALRVGADYPLRVLLPGEAPRRARLRHVDMLMDSASGRFRCVFTLDNADGALPAGAVARRAVVAGRVLPLDQVLNVTLVIRA